MIISNRTLKTTFTAAARTCVLCRVISSYLKVRDVRIKAYGFVATKVHVKAFTHAGCEKRIISLYYSRFPHTLSVNAGKPSRKAQEKKATSSFIFKRI